MTAPRPTALGAARERYLPDQQRSGIALCLSGGGFRATLFHLGALRRLQELGVLGKLDHISSVSGGSIMAAALAEAYIVAAQGHTGAIDFEALASRVRDLTSYNLRNTIARKRIFDPRNWRSSLAHLVESELRNRVTAHTLGDLPVRPYFHFCATDMPFGVNWTYTRDRVGDYEAGYTADIAAITIAHAAAASACFPPVFAPIEPAVDGRALTGGKATGAEADACRAKLRLTDGGVYDNMGLEPVWKTAATLLVCDAGGPFEFSGAGGTINDVFRYPDIANNQARALRKRWLVSSFMGGLGPGDLQNLQGTYWSTGSWRGRYQAGDAAGYDETLAATIARIRTDLDDFSAGERAVLENHGYLMADVALKVHVPQLYQGAPPVKAPFGEWLDPTRATQALAKSSKRKV